MGTGQLFRLHNLPANLSARVCGCVEIEIPFAIQQILCLFRCQGCLAINGAGDRCGLYRDLWPGIRSLRGRAVEMRCGDWTSQPAELNVIREFLGFRIQCGRQCARTRAVFGRDFGGGLQVGLQMNGFSVRGDRYQGESAYGNDGSDETVGNLHLLLPLGAGYHLATE
jgi:hypothetical protein